MGKNACLSPTELSVVFNKSCASDRCWCPTHTPARGYAPSPRDWERWLLLLGRIDDVDK